MEGLSDDLLLACSLQLRLVRSSHLADQRTPPHLVTQLCSRQLDSMFTVRGGGESALIKAAPRHIR